MEPAEQGTVTEHGHGGARLAEHGQLAEQGQRADGEPGEPAERAAQGSHERQRLEEFLWHAAGSIMQLLGQVSAERIGINVTDLNCLNIVALAGPMTAGELARETGLTTASITGVLDRLEEGGFVRRERDPKDRRRVIVKLNAGPGCGRSPPPSGRWSRRGGRPRPATRTRSCGCCWNSSAGGDRARPAGPAAGEGGETGKSRE